MPSPSDIDRLARTVANYYLSRYGSAERVAVVADLILSGLSGEDAEAVVDHGLSTGVLVLVGETKLGAKPFHLPP